MECCSHRPPVGSPRVESCIRAAHIIKLNCVIPNGRLIISTSALGNGVNSLGCSQM